MRERYDVVGIGGHPDGLEIVMGGTAAILIRQGLKVCPCTQPKGSFAATLLVDDPTVFREIPYG
jgi:hypothetical protein